MFRSGEPLRHQDLSQRLRPPRSTSSARSCSSRLSCARARDPRREPKGVDAPGHLHRGPLTHPLIFRARQACHGRPTVGF